MHAYAWTHVLVHAVDYISIYIYVHMYTYIYICTRSHVPCFNHMRYIQSTCTVAGGVRCESQAQNATVHGNRSAVPLASRILGKTWASALAWTWLTSEPLLKVKTFSLLIKVHRQTQKVEVLRANQKNTKWTGRMPVLAWSPGNRASAFEHILCWRHGV